MSDVGDLLELMHGAGDRWQSVETTVRQWRNVILGRVAVEHWQEELRRTGVGVSSMFAFAGDGEQPEEHEHTLRLSVTKPDRWREETADHVSVGRGPLWWSWSEHSGFVSNEADPEVRHGDPWLGGFRVRARPRPTRSFGRGLAHGADEHRLFVDPEREGTCVALSSETIDEAGLRELAGRLVRV